MKPDPATAEGRADIARWLINTCLLYGAALSTALIVAGYFTKGLEREWAIAGGEEEKGCGK